MKSIFLSFLFLVMNSFGLLAQEQAPSSEQQKDEESKPYLLSISVGYSYPKGDYGSTNIDDISSGFAKTGYVIDLDFLMDMEKIPFSIYTGLSLYGYEIHFRKLQGKKNQAQNTTTYRSYARTSLMRTSQLGLSYCYGSRVIKGFVTPYVGLASMRYQLTTSYNNGQTTLASDITFNDEPLQSTHSVLLGADVGVQLRMFNQLTLSLVYGYSRASFTMDRAVVDFNTAFGVEENKVKQLYESHNLKLRMGVLF